MARLPNGCTPEQQREYNRQYRRRLAGYRDWIDAIATPLGLTRDQLTTSTNAERVRESLAESQHRARGA